MRRAGVFRAAPVHETGLMLLELRAHVGIGRDGGDIVRR